MTLGLTAVSIPSALSLIKVFLFHPAKKYAKDTEMYLFWQITLCCHRGGRGNRE